MDIRSEYTRLRKNILAREKRIKKETGLATYAVNLPKASMLNDKQIAKAYAKAQRLNPKITTKATKERHERKLEKQRARQQAYRDIKKLWSQGRKEEAGFMKAARKWLRRAGLNPNLINAKNIADWVEYYNYRRSISNEKSKYEFEKFVTELAETAEEKQITAEELIADYNAYMADQASFIEQAKAYFGETTEEYSSESVSNRFFNGK